MDARRTRRLAIALTLLLGCFGVIWDLLAAAVLFFHSYDFFESVVVCLLVMILCALATMRADFELWSGVFREPKNKTDNSNGRDFLENLRAIIKSIFYGIAFLMAAIKLVLTLVG
jgi:hypothetical protein